MSVPPLPSWPGGSSGPARFCQHGRDRGRRADRQREGGARGGEQTKWKFGKKGVGASDESSEAPPSPPHTHHQTGEAGMGPRISQAALAGLSLISDGECWRGRQRTARGRRWIAHPLRRGAIG